MLNELTDDAAQRAGAPPERAPHCFLLRDIIGLDDAAIDTVARLHTQLLDFGPMAGLGERFVRTVGYELPIKAGLLHVTLGIVDGAIAGFVAYTTDSCTFQRETIRRHWVRVTWTLLRSVVEDPRRLWALPLAGRTVLSRNGLVPDPHTRLGEFAALVVKPEYTTVEFFRRTKVRVGEALTRHVIAFMQKAGVNTVRGLVDAHNKPALFMYQRLGARFQSCRVGGQPMVQVSFDFGAAHGSG